MFYDCCLFGVVWYCFVFDVVCVVLLLRVYDVFVWVLGLFTPYVALVYLYYVAISLLSFVGCFMVGLLGLCYLRLFVGCVACCDFCLLLCYVFVDFCFSCCGLLFGC